MSDSLYAHYLRERTSIEIIETDFGFITYSIEAEECYIRDLFILPMHRHAHMAKDLADKVLEIAKTKNCKYLTGSVCPTTKGSDSSVKVLMAYGMKLHSAINNLIIFKKDIVSWVE